VARDHRARTAIQLPIGEKEFTALGERSPSPSIRVFRKVECSALLFGPFCIDPRVEVVPPCRAPICAFQVRMDLHAPDAHRFALEHK